MVELKPGHTIAGRNRNYVIRRSLPNGGTARIYEAYSKDAANDVVAIKLWNNPQQHLQELEIANWKKTGLMDCLEEIIDPQAGQILGYAMPFRPVNLQEWYQIKLFRTQPEPRVKAAIYRIVDGIAAMHQMGFVHLDIKPQNILFAKQGVEPYVSDFSSAQRIVAFDQGKVETTRPYYPSHFPAGADPRLIDIYQVAATLYELFEGDVPRQNTAPSFRYTPHWARDALMQALEFKSVDIKNFRRSIEVGHTYHPKTPPQPASVPLLTSMIEGLSRPSWPPISAKLVVVLKMLLLLVATWLMLGSFVAVRDQGLYRLGVPFLVVALAIWRPSVAAFVALLIQALLLLGVAPMYGLTLGLLTLGLALGSLVTGNSWLLFLLAILPLLQHMVPLLLFPALAWLLKPSRFHSGWLPVATLAVGLWFSMYLIGVGARPFPEIYQHATGPSIDFTRSTPPTWSTLAQSWLDLLQTSRELNAAFIANLALLYPLWPLIAWGSVEHLGTLVARRLDTRLFKPLLRGVGSLCLLILTVMLLGIGIFFAAGSSWEPVFKQLGTILSQEGSLLVIILLLVSLFYDPSENDPPTRPVWPLALIMVATVALLSALPFLNTYLHDLRL